ncbi:MAG: monofunctional biosynthetic peptidoglycan transglycosylase [Deltaproteobacteria bacterium]|nr:monofunctional biosynthetic peptidoglycan transglycosylase [Deltaproteobacteria bacterium]
MYSLLLCTLLLGLLYIGMIPHTLYLRSHNPRGTALMAAEGGRTSQQSVSLSQISPWLQKAVLAAEDLDFYNHPGIDLHEIRESMKKNWKKKRWARGGSTITMQLAKNLYLSKNKTVIRKIIEVVIAFRLEHSLTKRRILELYLNLIEWGKGIYGAEAAARHYFRKPASILTAEEAAWLAAIIPNPKRYSSPGYARYIGRRKAMILRRIHGEPVEEPEELINEIPEEGSQAPGKSTPEILEELEEVTNGEEVDTSNPDEEN